MTRHTILYDTDGKRIAQPGVLQDGQRISVGVMLVDEADHAGRTKEVPMSSTLLKIGDRMIAADPAIVAKYRDMERQLEAKDGQLAAMDAMMRDTNPAASPVQDAITSRDAAYQAMSQNLSKAWERPAGSGWSSQTGAHGVAR